MNAPHLNVDSSLKSNRPIKRVGLISPTSGNLGNAAMQAAMIANIRKRIPDVEFVGITLNPDETYRRHGIEAFPLAGVSRANYGLTCSANSRAGHGQSLKPGWIRRWLKKTPILEYVLSSIRTFSKELSHIVAAAAVVKKLDRVIIPGGGALDDFWGGPWGQPWAIFKWSVLSRVYGVPFLFVSIGKCSLDSSLSRFFIRIALRLAEYRSYRDVDSKIAVQALINAPDDPVYPDLAFSFSPRINQASHDGASRDARLVVGVSPIAYCDPRAWPRKDERRYAAYVSQLAGIVRWLIREGHRVLFFTTDSPDSATVEDLQSMISGSAIDGDVIQTLASSTEESPDSLLRAISCVDLTIASRLHGVILSHLNSTPVLALSFDPKVDAHMNAVGQKEYCLSIDQLQLDTLIERFNALKAARQKERARLTSVARHFSQLLDQQYDRILDLSRPSAITGDYREQIDAPPMSEIGDFRTR